MTATVDLFVLEVVRGVDGPPLYVPEWLFAGYTDTGGLWEEGANRELEFQVKGRGVIIDALFGDGPKRYGFTTNRLIKLVDFNHATQQVFDFAQEDGKIEDVHLVIRRNMMERVRLLYEGKERHILQAFSLSEFQTFLLNLPHVDQAKLPEITRSMNGFLLGLNQRERLLLPIIGMGLSFHWEALKEACGYRAKAIISPNYLE